ncbi:cache domain-containing sensor histidine kinase [Paenibacillus piri]|uniref:Sensor histidine kinase n=1 Tax=Paenibacillus piri TaxID=2547395 RepID=A0A4R5KWQ6_9BACL|nr:sensor histidine kinase [Paenibacillus piri]TDG00470.1 sensor histidine kinase [Paenibacillus piri]
MNNLFKRTRIDYLMYGGFSSVMVILLSVVIGLTYTLSTQEMVRMTSFYQQGLLNELYNKTEIQMRAIEQHSLAAARNTTLSEYSNSPEDTYSNYQKGREQELYLASITYATPIIQSIDYYTTYEAPVITRQSPVTFFSEREARLAEWYPVVENTDFAWIGEHKKHTYQGEARVVSFARKIYSGSGTYQGLLVMNVNASSVQNLVRGETPDSNRLLLDSDGRVIVSIGDPQLQTKLKDYMADMQGASGHMQARAKGQGGLFSQPIAYLIVWAKHPGVNWTLVELTPWSKITQGSVHTAVILAVVGASAILISMLITLLLANQFIKPLRLLVREMGRYSGGGNKISLPDDYRNEFGVLFSGYRKLISRIQLLYASLENQYRRQKKAEIKALQAMINPHFLYNTLDQLNWMALAAGQDKLSHILELMGKMFRIGLSNGESMITFREEFIHAECYLQIQQLRWEEGLTVRLELPGPVQELFVPKMTLQPFIENAIMHGFNERTKGCIEISVHEEEEDVVIRITDDGAGLSAGWDTPGKRKTGGYGIRNVRERYEAFFGSRFSIHIANNAGSSGATVQIRLPVLRSKEPENRGEPLEPV